MVLGQSAAVAACQAIDKKIPVQQVNIRAVQDILKTNPLADGSTPELLVDNEDANVQVTGNWKTEKTGGYGPSFLIDTSKAATAGSVRFTPEVVKDGTYHVYSYFHKVKNASANTVITVYDGQKATEKVINQADIQVQGQTSGEWISLGAYNLSRGKKAYVQVLNKNADGAIIADAVLFVPVR
jgi:hypothetical protein